MYAIDTLVLRVGIADIENGGCESREVLNPDREQPMSTR